MKLALCESNVESNLFSTKRYSRGMMICKISIFDTTNNRDIGLKKMRLLFHVQSRADRTSRNIFLYCIGLRKGLLRRLEAATQVS